MFNLLLPLKNSRGSAIMFSMFMMSILVFIAMEVSKDSVVEYQGSLNSVRRVQAYYAAKSCTDLSLLRIKAYQQARSLAKSLPNPGMLDMIWQFPLSWPIVAPATASESDKSAIKDKVKTSIFKNQFSSKITGQSRKIDINDLASASESMRNKTRQQLLNLIQIKLRDGSEWSKKYANFRFDNLLYQIADWADADNISQLGGDEASYYREMRSPSIPPNQSFKTMDELHMVAGMEDEIYDFLAPIITIYGSKGVNINYAEKDFLMGLDPRISSDIADKIIQRRTDISLGGPFKDAKDFASFLSGYGINDQDFNKDKIPLFFDQEINFYISCIGSVGRITREVDSVVYDFKKVQSRLSANMIADANPNNGTGNCQGKTGEDLYKCNCQAKTDPTQNKACIDAARAAAGNGTSQQTQPDQSADVPSPGPPYIIFQDVK